MSDRRRAPILAHLLAAFMGMGFDADLAKDYWFGREEPWSAEHDVPFRFAKLAYMYAASAVVQAGIPMLLLGLASDLYRTAPGASFQVTDFVVYVTASLTLLAITAGVLIAFLAWRKLMKQRRSAES